LLDGRRCTTHHSLLDELRQLAPTAEVLDSRVFVEDGEVCTSAGITAGIDLALHLIAKLGSPRLAVAVAREMAVYMRRAAGDPALSPWLEGRNHMNMAIHRVQDALLKAPAQDWPLSRLADIGHLSVRSLTRHFREASGMSVNRYHARLRVALARQALANGDNVEHAAERAGLGSARQLRRLWSAHADEFPSSVRKRG
jgi:transcriptional regulator GlxA family with amidase domain